MSGVLWFWTLWNAVITLGAFACLAYERRDDPDRHHFHLEETS